MQDDVDTDTIYQDIKNIQNNKPLAILPDTYLIKMTNGDETNNGYALLHLNRKNIFLVDVLALDVLKTYQDKGYHVSGLGITHNELVDKNRLEEVTEILGDAPIFMHPLESQNYGDLTTDALQPHDAFKGFSIQIYDGLGTDSGDLAFYSEINNGMLFTGKTAKGSEYDSENTSIERPRGADTTNDIAAAENWRRFTATFLHVLPGKGKPALYLTEGEQKDLIIQLGKKHS